MGRRRSAWIGLAGWLVAGCSYTAFPAESTAVACFNSLDDDRDGLFNCDDPDCWHLAYCQPSDDGGLPPLGQPHPPDQIPMMPDDTIVPPGDDHSMTDGSTPVGPPMDRDARVPDVETDASVDAELPPVVCSEYCPLGQCDAEGSCNTPLDFGKYDVTSVEVSVPNMRDRACFDYRFTCGLPFGCCDPDPIVTLYVDDKKAGFLMKADTRVGTLEPAMMQVALREGDEVEFVVEDKDAPEVGDDIDSAVPEKMFLCATVVTVGSIESGRIRCVPDPEAYAFPPGAYHVTASLRSVEDEDEDDDSDDGDQGP